MRVWDEERTIAVRGVTYQVCAAGQGSPLALLHGFAGSSAHWAPLAPELVARGWRVIAPDLLGHGRTDAPSAPTRYAAAEQVTDLASLLGELVSGPIRLLGYSMGGRLALHLALAHPERIAALVLESASPGLDDPAERAARQRADEELATAIEQRGLDWFADYWERLPLFASRQRLSAERRTALRAEWLAQRPHGLGASLRGFGTGSMPAVWDRLSELRMPVLVIAGALDTRYAALSQAMAARIPASQLVIVPAAGHTVHLEQPAAFLAALERFFRQLPDR
ncbi:2-succinyl-6-hydroxy-2,4-cyclohexadiene-1-carboxylate synthase [Thermomicrobium sp.]|uniref:2-succinyl-6-hydroxy-2, 4-cyclohexadiene-1-carboxylate synthase n=1 Tax=Thermomicrobium sp. TaxID=1969469 RepID=UPI00257968D4|nr:2-succinyl-6-hydroxy-2,4-cyclohexadiene-1-carboxylate synthase [Thermomicrobium sp.]